MPAQDAAAIILAAGVGRRLGAETPKAFLALGRGTMLTAAAKAAAAVPAIGRIIVTAPPGYETLAREQLKELTLPSAVVTGGRTRQASVRAALGVVQDASIVAVHDAARPFASPALFAAVIDAVRDGADGAVPIVQVADTVKRVHEGQIVATVDRSELGLAQTPQAFAAPLLRRAHARAVAAGDEVTDDAGLLEDSGKVVVVPGDPGNFKITTMLDLARARARMGDGDE